MKKLTLAYFGAPDFSAYYLEKIITDNTIKDLINIKYVFTQPDRPTGRKQIITPTPVKTIAQKYNIEVITQLTDLRINELKNMDLVLLYAYGGIIPNHILSIPKYGFWNIHPSLLPNYRGTSPIATPLINGDKITGVTLMKMDDKIDHGPIIDQVSYTIKNNDLRPDLERNLTDLGVKLFKKIINELKNSQINKLNMKEQNHKEATYTKKLKKEDGFIKFEDLKLALNKIKGLKSPNYPEKIYNLFRGLYPWPGIWTILPVAEPRRFREVGKRLKITKMSFKSGKLIINKVQLEGKNEVDFETFNKAYKIFDAD